MKKIMITLFVVMLSIALGYGYADALTGVCSGCHTMHNSQNGQTVATDFNGSSLATPQPNLTVSTCLGCHNGQAAGAPVVFGTAGNFTAGGSFNDGVFTDDSFGHNVKDLNDASVLTVGLESVITNTPGAEAGGYTEPVPTTLTCAGTLGCHGNHDSGAGAGITGFHHGQIPAYRFLRFFDGTTTHTNVGGKGSTDWEVGGADATNHNVYLALTSDNATERDSISSLCSLCHGDFHDDTDTSSGGLWTRHPTEIAIPTDWSATVDYNLNPFGFDTAAITSVETSAAYTQTNAKVVCVSCHRAHASDQPDALRFDYSTMSAGSTTVTTGCLGCHSEQRG